MIRLVENNEFLERLIDVFTLHLLPVFTNQDGETLFVPYQSTPLHDRVSQRRIVPFAKSYFADDMDLDVTTVLSKTAGKFEILVVVVWRNAHEFDLKFLFESRTIGAPFICMEVMMIVCVSKGMLFTFDGRARFECGCQPSIALQLSRPQTKFLLALFKKEGQ